MNRKAGVLLHISALPNKYGIGTLGKSAYDFVDYLAGAKQKLWQVLPIGPTSYGDSPYQSPSVYAYNPYFIDFELLTEQGLLAAEEYENESFGYSSDKIDYRRLFEIKGSILEKAYKNKGLVQKKFDSFKEKNDFWLSEFALYSVIKAQQNYKPWNAWPAPLKLRDKKTIENCKREFSVEIDTQKFIQFLFRQQWDYLKGYANSKGVEIIGDIPIYVAYDSADVWANPELFQLDKHLNPISVAGCPPDSFSADGQLWGNPLYNWDLMKKNNYKWWINRIEKNSELFDITRIDHFRGFAAYFSIPYGDTTAKNGEWVTGPGYDLFAVVNKELPDVKIIAENLGFIDEETEVLLDKCGYPGMVIGQYEFLGQEVNKFQQGFPINNVIYTGTHDNQTILSWFEELSERDQNLVENECMFDFTHKPNLKIIQRIFHTAPAYVVIPFQDYLGLKDFEGRVNIPSTLGINWMYRTSKEDFKVKIQKYMEKITIESNRLG